MARLGKYELIERIGMGGMAEIWRARTSGPSGFEKTVALKRILPHLLDNRQFIDMFIDEAKLVASLTHPNIVQVFDFEISENGEHFITMEYVPGPNLAHVVTRLHEEQMPLPYEVSIYIVSEACKGLGFAHDFRDKNGDPAPIIHRDISPHNLLVSRNGAVKVADYGIAKVQSAIGNTQAGVLKGKIAYMSPEYVRQEGVDHRSDLFSLGIVLFRLVTGGKLFAGEHTAQILTQISDYTGPKPEDLEGLPEGLRNVLEVALQLNPDDRYQSALDFEAALSSIIDVKGLFQARKSLARLIETLYGDQFKPAEHTESLTESDDASLAPRAGSAPSRPSDVSSSMPSRTAQSPSHPGGERSDELSMSGPAALPREPTAVTSAINPPENTGTGTDTVEAGPDDATMAMSSNPLLDADLLDGDMTGSATAQSFPEPEVSQPSLARRSAAPDADPVPQSGTVASNSVPTGAPSEDGTKILDRDGRPPSISRPSVSAPAPAPRVEDPPTRVPSMQPPMRPAAVVQPAPMQHRPQMAQPHPAHDPDATSPFLPEPKKNDTATLWLLAILPLLIGLFLLLLAIFLMQN